MGGDDNACSECRQSLEVGMECVSCAARFCCPCGAAAYETAFSCPTCASTEPLVPWARTPEAHHNDDEIVVGPIAPAAAEETKPKSPDASLPPAAASSVPICAPIRPVQDWAQNLQACPYGCSHPPIAETSLSTHRLVCPGVVDTSSLVRAVVPVYVANGLTPADVRNTLRAYVTELGGPSDQTDASVLATAFEIPEACAAQALYNGGGNFVLAFLELLWESGKVPPVRQESWPQPSAGPTLSSTPIAASSSAPPSRQRHHVRPKFSLPPQYACAVALCSAVVTCLLIGAMINCPKAAATTTTKEARPHVNIPVAPAVCPALGDLGALHISLRQVNPSTASATFLCPEGLRLVGRNRLECVNGVWSDTLPSCQAKLTPQKFCPTPTPPRNGFFDLTSTVGGQGEVLYACDEGYQLTGVAKLTCSPDGKWVGAAPTCARVIHPCEVTLPAAPARARVEFVAHGANGAAQYACHYPYVMDGEATRTCTAGRWSGQAPRCVHRGLLKAKKGHVVDVIDDLIEYEADYNDIEEITNEWVTKMSDSAQEMADKSQAAAAEFYNKASRQVKDAMNKANAKVKDALNNPEVKKTADKVKTAAQRTWDWFSDHVSDAFDASEAAYGSWGGKSHGGSNEGEMTRIPWAPTTEHPLYVSFGGFSVR